MLYGFTTVRLPLRIDLGLWLSASRQGSVLSVAVISFTTNAVMVFTSLDPSLITLVRFNTYRRWVSQPPPKSRS